MFHILFTVQGGWFFLFVCLFSYLYKRKEWRRSRDLMKTIIYIFWWWFAALWLEGSSVRK